MFVAMLRSFCMALAAVALFASGSPCAAAQPQPHSATVVAPQVVSAADCPGAGGHAPAHSPRAPVIVCTFACAAVMPAPAPSGLAVRAVYAAEFSTTVERLSGLSLAPRAPPPRLVAS